MPSGSRPIGNFYVQLGLNTQTFRRNLAEAQRDLRNAFGTAAIHASEVLAASIGAIGVALAGLSVKAVQLSADLDKQRLALERMLGSAEAATDKIKELQQFAAKTGFAFSDLVDYQKRLMAVGFTAEETKFMLYQIADATAIIGNDSDKISRLIKAFGDVKAKGNLQTQEIKQFAELGIPAWNMLSVAIGKSRDELTKLVEGRKISADTALWGITSEIQKRWGGMAEDISKTLSGAFNRLKTVIQIELTELGDWIKENVPLSDIFNGITEAVTKTAEAIKSSGLMGAFNTFAEKFPNITKSLQIIGETIVLLLIPGMASMAMYMSMMTIPLLKLVAVGLLIVEVLPRILSSAADLFDNLSANITGIGLSLKKWVLENFAWFLGKVHELEVSLRMIAYDIGEQVAVTGDNIINGLIKGLSYVTNWILRTIKKTMLAVHEIIESTFKSFDMYLQAIMPQNAYEGIKELLDKSKAQIKKFKDDEGTPKEQNVFRSLMGYKTTDDERKKARESEKAFWEQESKVVGDIRQTVVETDRQLKSQKIIAEETFKNFESGIIGVGEFFTGLKSEGKNLWESLINPVKDVKNALESPWKVGENPVGGGEAKTNIPSVKTKEIKMSRNQKKGFFGTTDTSLSTDEIHFVGDLLPYKDAAEKAGYELMVSFVSPLSQITPAIAESIKAGLEESEVELTEYEQWVGGIWQNIGTTLNTVFYDALMSSENFFKNVGESLHKLGNQILAQIAQLAMMSMLFNALGIKTAAAIPSGLQIFRGGNIITGSYLGGKINDGIVSNGKVITTHPDDYIMAAKDPSSLGGKPNVVVNVNNNSSSEVSTNSYFDGTRTIVDIVIDGLQRNVNGLRDTIRAI